MFLFAVSLLGQSLGPLLPGLFNDYVFRNADMLGYSVAMTVALASIAAIVVFRITYRPYRIHHAMIHGD